MKMNAPAPKKTAKNAATPTHAGMQLLPERRRPAVLREAQRHRCRSVRIRRIARDQAVVHGHSVVRRLHGDFRIPCLARCLPEESARVAQLKDRAVSLTLKT